MTELQMTNGDFVPNGAGDFCRLEGRQALLQRILFKLTARRGAFPFLPQLGSYLHTLAKEKRSARQTLCDQYVRQALEEEDVTVTGVIYTEQGDQAQVRVNLEWQGESLEVTTQLGGTTYENSGRTLF